VQSAGCVSRKEALHGDDMSKVSVQFLGSGDAFGSGGRFQTCIYVDAGIVRFLLDCGASSLIAMKRYGVDPSLVDIILLTHLHGDHFGGLPFFVLDAQLISRRTKPLVIAGPPGLEMRIRDAMEVLFPGSSIVTQKFSVDFIELNDKKATRIGSLVVKPYCVVHESGAPAYALRVESGGKTIAYSGDTEWTDSLLGAARGTDLFICEAYFFKKKLKYHLNYQTLLAHRAQLGCRRLVLTHMNDDMLARLGSIDAEYAEDGKRLVL
jgi:ribonuclease BN (tRNA processing enzyme)